MAYRGEDLDLRTPQGWSSTGRDAGTGEQPNWFTRSTIYKGGRGDPIWVDEAVMACCNHAHDLALAHRAPEVRLEHLINALTLNEAAATVLESRGLSVASLRRESGQYIANEIPASNGSQVAPKRSEALEEMLRLAADHAYPRRTPVTVEDLLHVLFDVKRDLPGVHLLQRHAQGWGRNGGERAELRLEPLPHLTRPYSGEARPMPGLQPSPQPAPLPRYATPAAHDYFSQSTPREMSHPAPRDPAPVGREPMREPPRAAPREMQPPPGTVDGVQNNRIESLERVVRDLGLDLADDRKTLQTLVGELQRSAAAQADDTGRFRGSLNERFAALEDVLARSRGDQAMLPAAIMERIGAIERSIEGRLAELGRSQPPAQLLIDRIAALERSLDSRLAEISRAPSQAHLVLERVAALERSLETRLGEIGRLSQTAPAVVERIGAIERTIESRLTDLGRATNTLGERLQVIELASHRPVEATLTPLVSQRLESITAFGSKVESLERTFQVILDRITGLERKVGSVAEATAVDLSPVESRFTDLEAAMVGAIEKVDLSPVTDLLSGIEGRVVGLERALENRTAETGRTVSFIGERLRAFEEAIGGSRTQLAEKLVQTDERLVHAGDRLTQIERSVASYAESAAAASGTHERELTEVHEALLKLNANQQTLASSLEQWRLDNTGDLSVIVNRLKGIEEVNAQRVPVVVELAHQVEAIHAALAKREVRKSRFRHWLFGTDEWYSASYHTRTWRARQAGMTPVAVPASPPPVTRTADVQPLQRPAPPPPPTALRR